MNGFLFSKRFLVKYSEKTVTIHVAIQTSLSVVAVNRLATLTTEGFLALDVNRYGSSADFSYICLVAN